MTETEKLERVKATVRNMVPNAKALEVETTDQDYHGFVMLAVVLMDERDLHDVDQALSNRVDEAICDDLMDLSWDGVVGEDKHGNATVAIAPE